MTKGSTLTVIAALALTGACGGGPGSPTSPATPTPSPTPPPAGFTLVREQRLVWPADPSGVGIGFDFVVTAPGDVEVELVDGFIAAQTTSTHVYLTLLRANDAGQATCERFDDVCLGIANDDAIVAPGSPLRRLVATATTTSTANFVLVVRNLGPTGTVQANARAWFRARS